MDLISKLFVLPILLLTLGTISFVAPIVGIEAPKHRYVAIDGMRGFLAMFVFLLHSNCWYYFARKHRLGMTSSHVFGQFGSTSVAFFFMITAFLFFSKLIDSRGHPFDWLKLYVSRILRIMPLYLFTVVIIFLVVGILTQFQLQEYYSRVLLEFGKWILIMGPDINQLHPTKVINLEVQWSLAYEWILYCSLPLIGWAFFRLKTSLSTLLLATIFAVIFAYIADGYNHSGRWLWLCPFGTGLIAAFIARNQRAKKVLTNSWIPPALLILLYIGLFIYPSIVSPVAFLCYSIVFVAIACGNTLFGLLSWKPCRQLGQITYSIYLVHGIVLFVVFYFCIGLKQTAQLSIVEHWLVIAVSSILLVILCAFTYYYIEKPGIEGVKMVTGKICQLFKKKSAPSPSSSIVH